MNRQQRRELDRLRRKYDGEMKAIVEATPERIKTLVDSVGRTEHILMYVVETLRVLSIVGCAKLGAISLAEDGKLAAQYLIAKGFRPTRHEFSTIMNFVCVEFDASCQIPSVDEIIGALS